MTSLVLIAGLPAMSRGEGTLSAEAKRLFELGGSPSVQAFLAAQNHYDALPKAVRDHALMQYTYCLVLIRQKRLLEVEPMLEKAASSRPQDLSIWQAKIWSHLTLGERAKAIEELARFDRKLLSQPPAGRNETDAGEAAEFCGKIFGFLAGPWNSRLHAADLDKLRGEVRSQFESADQKAFDQAEQEVLAEYERLHGQHEQLGQEALDEDRKQLQQSRAELLQAATSLLEKQQSLTDKNAKRANELKTKLAEIDGKLGKLQKQAETLLQKILPLELSREALMSQFLPVNVPLLTGKRSTPADAAAFRYNFQIQQLLAPVVSQLLLLQGELAQVQDAMFELQWMKNTLAFQRGQDASKIAMKKQALQRQQAKVDRQGKRLKAAPTGNTVEVRSDAMRLRLLSTYVEFPFEREKQRVLSMLERQ
jgi:hypothetical protein